MLSVFAMYSAYTGSLARKSRKRPTSFGFFVRFSATNAAPPGIPVHPPGPQGLGTTIQSKFLPICFSMRLICQLPER